MEKPRTIEDDPMQRTLQDYVEQMRWALQMML